VKSRKRHDRIEGAFPRLPGLKVGSSDLDVSEPREVPSCDGRHLLAEFYADDLIAALRERPGRLSGPAADLDDTRSVSELTNDCKVVKEYVRVAWSSTVV
jgi:hypothetical protein